MMLQKTYCHFIPFHDSHLHCVIQSSALDESNQPCYLGRPNLSPEGPDPDFRVNNSQVLHDVVASCSSKNRPNILITSPFSSLKTPARSPDTKHCLPNLFATPSADRPKQRARSNGARRSKESIPRSRAIRSMSSSMPPSPSSLVLTASGPRGILTTRPSERRAWWRWVVMCRRRLLEGKRRVTVTWRGEGEKRAGKWRR